MKMKRLIAELMLVLLLAGGLVIAAPFGGSGEFGALKLTFQKLKWSIFPKTSGAIDVGSTTKKIGEIHVIDLYVDHIAGDTVVETVTDGDFITNSGTAKNPILDVDVDDSSEANTRLWTAEKITAGLANEVDVADSALHYHNEHYGLQGGSANEYYHMTLAQHGEIGNWQAATDKVEADSASWDAAYTLKGVLDALSGLMICDGAGNYTVIVDNSGDWNTVTDKLDIADTSIFALADGSRNITGSQEFEAGATVGSDKVVVSEETNLQALMHGYVTVTTADYDGTATITYGNTFTAIPTVVIVVAEALNAGYDSIVNVEDIGMDTCIVRLIDCVDDDSSIKVNYIVMGDE